MSAVVKLYPSFDETALKDAGAMNGAESIKGVRVGGLGVGKNQARIKLVSEKTSWIIFRS